MKKMYKMLFVMSKKFDNESVLFEYYTDDYTCYELKITNLKTHKPITTKICYNINHAAKMIEYYMDYYRSKGYHTGSFKYGDYKSNLKQLKNKLPF